MIFFEKKNAMILLKKKKEKWPEIVKAIKNFT